MSRDGTDSYKYQCSQNKEFYQEKWEKNKQEFKKIQQSKCHKYLQIVEQNLQYTGK
jgi:hypothetical protein